MKIRIVIFFTFSIALAHGLINFDKENCAACKITTATIVEGMGYPAETHMIQTIDGYNLTIFRVPYGKHNIKRGPRIPVLVQYGANANSDSMVTTYDTKDSYVTLLADHGYDVWLGNFRGSRYARHKKYKFNQFEYWNYTIDDVALIDYKAMVDYVLGATNHPSLAYVTHSMGGIALSMLLSGLPEYNEKVHYAQLLSPVVYADHNKHLVINTFAGKKPIIDPMKLKLLEFLVNNRLVSSYVATSSLTSKIGASVCEQPQLRDLCVFSNGFLLGFDPESFPKKDLELYFNAFGQGFAAKPTVQLAQMTLAGKLQKFDFHNKNMAAYGTSSPPPYNLSNIRTTIQLYCPKNDYLLDLKDCDELFVNLDNAKVSKHIIENKRFNHFDFLSGESRLSFYDVAIRDMDSFHNENIN